MKVRRRKPVSHPGFVDRKLVQFPIKHIEIVCETKKAEMSQNASELDDSFTYQNELLAAFQSVKRNEFVKVCTIKRWHTSMRDAKCVSLEFPVIQGFAMVIFAKKCDE